MHIYMQAALQTQRARQERCWPKQLMVAGNQWTYGCHPMSLALTNPTIPWTRRWCNNMCTAGSTEILQTIRWWNTWQKRCSISYKGDEKTWGGNQPLKLHFTNRDEACILHILTCKTCDAWVGSIHCFCFQSQLYLILLATCNDPSWQLGCESSVVYWNK